MTEIGIGLLSIVVGGGIVFMKYKAIAHMVARNQRKVGKASDARR